MRAASYEADAPLTSHMVLSNTEHSPHFMIFPGDRVEVMECLAIPGMQ
jgi:hypothetical protein